MTQVMIQLEDELSKELHQVCEDIGLPVSAAFLIFAKRVARDRKIPLELSAAPDPFHGAGKTGATQRGSERILEQTN